MGLGLMAGKSLLGPAVKTGLKKAGYDSSTPIGEQISNAIFGGPTDTAASTIGAGAESFDKGYNILDAMGGVDTGLDLGVSIAETGNAISSMGDAADVFDMGYDIASIGDMAGGGIPWFTIANLVTGGEAGKMAGDAVGLVGNLFSDIFGGLFS